MRCTLRCFSTSLRKTYIDLKLIIQKENIMKKILLSVFVIANACIGFSQVPAACSDLFFSEYIEGSGQNKALEIYNPTPNSIDLSNYHIYRYVNGSTTPGDTLYMSGMLLPGDTYNIVDPDSTTSATLVALEDTLHTVTFFNGNDPLYLFNLTVLDRKSVV